MMTCRESEMPWSSEEPARQTAYRRLYMVFKARLDQQDDTIEYLIRQINELRSRMRMLEIKDVKTNSGST